MNATVQPNFDPDQIQLDALRIELLIRTLIKEIRTAIPVEVMAVHPGVGNPPANGTVDVQPLVQTIDGSGKLWALKQTYGASFCRAQAGNTAFVLDPEVGDIGLAVVCDRDISSVIASGGLAGPGSARTYDISDLMYVLSVKSTQAITQYILANASGITMKSPNNITINGVTIDPDGNVMIPGDLEAAGTVKGDTDVVNGAGTSLTSHEHPTAATGPPSPPIPGS